MQDLQPRLLKRALEIVGNEETFCKRLGSAERHAVRLWLDGRATAPAEVLHAAINIILEDDLARAAQDRRRQPRQDRQADATSE